MGRRSAAVAVATALLVAACATRDGQPQARPLPYSEAEQRAAQQSALQPSVKLYKRKVAIGRFTNESNYGKGLLVDANFDPLGKQASDTLATLLQGTGRFVVFERLDLHQIRKEQSIGGSGNLVGVDAVILGSVTEFGRATEGKTGFLSSTKVQRVRAKVNLRLVDVATARVFFAADGTGEAITETGEVAGFGSRAAYDSTLNEKAISTAISGVLDNLIRELEARPWRTYVLAVDGPLVFISGGQRQGLRIGDELVVMRPGREIVSKQTGLPIQLPGEEVARLRVQSQFGDDEVSEGSACTVIGGSLDPESFSNLIVTEVERS